MRLVPFHQTHQPSDERLIASTVARANGRGFFFRREWPFAIARLHLTALTDIPLIHLFREKVVGWG